MQNIRTCILYPRMPLFIYKYIWMSPYLYISEHYLLYRHCRSSKFLYTLRVTLPLTFLLCLCETNWTYTTAISAWTLLLTWTKLTVKNSITNKPTFEVPETQFLLLLTTRTNACSVTPTLLGRIPLVGLVVRGTHIGRTQCHVLLNRTMREVHTGETRSVMDNTV